MKRTLTPRYMLIHSDSATIDMNNLSPFAHAFGPFEDYKAVLAFDREVPDDTCYRFAVPIVGPDDVDLRIMLTGRLAGVRPAAVMLPPREPEKAGPASTLHEVLQEAFAQMERDERKRQKAARKEAKRKKRAEREEISESEKRALDGDR